MFDLVGRRLSPRIAKLTDKQLYRARAASHYKAWPLAGALLKHHAQIDLIDAPWDDLLRIGASLKQGYVSAALLIAKLQAGSRQHPLTKATLEYASCCARCTRCAGSPTKHSGGASAASSTAAKRSTTYAASSSSPTAEPSATPTTTTKPPRRTATPSSSTPASSPPPATSKTPSTRNEPTGTPSATKRSPHLSKVRVA
jgi:hypothetical protein